MTFQERKTFKEKMELMSSLSKQFSLRAHQFDVDGSFPIENFQELRDSGYTSLTVPKKYGGQEITLHEMLRFQERIAEGDGSTALSIGWHMGIIKNLAEKQTWKDSVFEMICEQVKKGALINSAASEARTGSPTRGGKPETKAVRKGGSWLITGRKTFTTMAPVLDFFIVSASIENSNEVGNFLIPRTASGIEIEETWDSIALRGTGSHDLILTNVVIPDDYFVEKLGTEGKKTNGWLLHIPACYLGIAKAAKRHAIKFSLEYSPNSLNGPIIDLPTVQQKIGDIELKILQSESILYSAAHQWEQGDEFDRAKMGPIMGAAKLTVTNAAISVVDIAMRIVGAKSLSAKNPLQRYYRDVRAGLHNPPMDDMTIQLLANSAIQSYKNE